MTIIDYQTLGLDEDAGDEAVRARYLELVHKFTPEKAPETFMRITRAYEALKDRRSRIKSGITGLDDYRLWTDALAELVAGIPEQRRQPGLSALIEAQQND